MQTVWKGSISFGLLNVPVKMSTATARESLRFRTLHSKCHTPLKQKRFCAKCNQEVEFHDTVKGYEYEENKFVIIDDEDLENIPVESTKTVEIVDFIKLEEVDPIYYDKSYYLRPNEGGEKPYLILRDAMTKTGRVAVAKVTIRQKEHLALVRVSGKALLLETMFFPAEVRGQEELGLPELEERVKIKRAELDMAIELVENLTEEFNPEKYKDEYREELLKIIRKKAQGQDVTVVEPEKERPQVVDLMERLKASVEATKKVAGD
ncbi:DNA end-binding protein Ku [Desulfitispora alkaliphila]|uniref:non-homologous end joining protein Ku n=1 Tax=Desulfitispora alkaliphila TaxID=622674 RepID=UPI003D242167